MSKRASKTLLVITQVYLPDPSSAGQHIADVAEEMVLRGWRVKVYTANCGYDNPALKFLSHEILNGVEIRRFPFSSFGKNSIRVRLFGQFFFLLQCFVGGIFLKDLKTILATTSPPMGSLMALFVRFFRHVSIKWWVLDLNPDQAVEMGLFKPDSFLVKLFDWLNRHILTNAADIIALDRFMKERLTRKIRPRGRLSIIPPWPLDEHSFSVIHSENPFRQKYGLEGKFVVMYSGNHSISHPLTTVLEATRQFLENSRVVFFFIGGGRGKQEIKAFITRHEPPNVYSLPYQPLDRIKYSLSAADLHLAALGNRMVGCNHPCKIYGSMALGKAFLYLGPKPCHITDIIEQHDCGWHVNHSDVEKFVKTINHCLEMNPEELVAIGQRGKAAIQQEFTKQTLCGRICDVIEAD